MNHLAKEKSPYLLQHAYNPVDWYPWSEEAFEKAKKENKPVFLSVGYSTCHWCHVMAHESFENSEIAKILNDHFISIKVDREERPDIDGVYMAVVMAMTGSGGWPLSVFLTPDKEPFYGGTYFPPEPKWGSTGFKNLLFSISDAWKERKSDILQSSRSVIDLLINQSNQQKEKLALEEEVFHAAYRQFLGNYDSSYGGFGSQPKFPSSHQLSFLLHYDKRAGEPRTLEMVEKTLQEMAKGGMCDHLGGGFHRYSTDHKWHVPHFEKMLYDQAILARTYLEAYQATKKEEYANVAREIFDYVLRDMQRPQGGFFSAEDADSLPPENLSSHEKKEGAFFIWSKDEIVKILGAADAEIFNFYFGVEEQGNAEYDPHGEFTGKNILHIVSTVKEAAKRFKKSEGEIAQILKDSKEKLYIARSKRPKPHLDDKVLVDWNGLMISSLALGSRVLDEPRYLEAARKAAVFILKNLSRKDGRLLHRYRDGEAAILGHLDDYAFFIHGLMDLYEASFEVEYLKEAQRLTKSMFDLFWDEDEGSFFFTAQDAEEIIFRRKEIYDGAIPSGNSIAALALIRLGKLFMNSDWEQKARRILENASQELVKNPSAYTQMLMALDFALGPTKEIVVAGDFNDTATQNMISLLYQNFIPRKVVVFRPAKEKEAAGVISLIPFSKNQSPINGKTTAYICENYACQLPTNDVEKFRGLLNLR